jgi:hypothetical protein
VSSHWLQFNSPIGKEEFQQKPEDMKEKRGERV